jgi:RNA polymerase sigma factor (sigma-70 family)
VLAGDRDAVLARYWEKFSDRIPSPFGASCVNTSVSEQRPGLLATVDEPGDAELISAVRAGDTDAYGLLFARHVEAARRLARQLVSAGDVDDLVSEAFAKVLSVLQRGGGPDLAFRAYLLTSVRRLHVDKIRGTARLQTTDDLTPYDPGVPFEDTAVAGFENAAAARAFASLPERWQQVLWHTEVEGQKPGEIAVLLGMTPNSVSALAYRAREGLRQAFVTMHARGDEPDELCSTTRANLGAYLRGGLSRRDCAKVEAHLEDCRECSAIYLELAEVNADLGAVLAPLLLGSAGAGYLVAAHAGAIAAKGGLLLFLDRGRDWVLHNPVGRVAGGTAAAAVTALAVVAGLALTGPAEKPTAAAPKPAARAPGQSSGGGTATPSPNPTPPASPAPPVGVEPAPAPPPVPAAPVAAPSVPTSAPPSSPSSPPPSAPTNGAPVIVTPLAAVSLRPESNSVVIDLTRGARDPDGDALRVRSAKVRGTHPHGTVHKGGTAVRTPTRESTAPLARAPLGAGAARAGRSRVSTVTYRPEPAWRGTETIVYVLTDGESNVAGTVRVRTPNRRPLARDDAVTLPYSSLGRPVTLDVLGNDSDPNHDALVVASVGAVTGPLGGTAAPTDGGRAVSYTPGLADLVAGTASFSYTVADGHGGRATATATVVYTAAPPEPVTGAMSLTQHHDEVDWVAHHFAATGIPDGRSATFRLTITGMTAWHNEFWVEGPAQCPARPEPANGRVVVTCTVSGNGDFLHVDFDGAPGWRLSASLTANGFRDTTTGDDAYDAADPDPDPDPDPTSSDDVRVWSQPDGGMENP